MSDPTEPEAFDATVAAPATRRPPPISATDDTLAGDPRSRSSATDDTLAGDPRPGSVSADDPTLVGEGERTGPRLPVPGEATRIGRYVVLEALGAGGMGVVVAAYDPKLDRKVAIKLLHTTRRDDLHLRLRMEREAQAMARLSHPNVVTIYEVGEHERQLYLAMEFVKGRDLRAWLSERGSGAGWRAVLDVFFQAGQGLAAAHAVGIVHRDFKPGNVFVGDDGRVRVGDFGLARRGSEGEVAAPGAARESALGQDMTRTGAAMGTPSYMAPEQFEGRATDARTDQFAFCVALWEALHGRRPFAGDTFAELLLNVTSGVRAPPPPGSAAPAWLRRVLDRGLSREPGDRYPTTEALLAALRADPTRRQRLLAGIGAAALALAGGFVVQGWLGARAVTACEVEGASIAAVWNDDARQRLQDGLERSGAAQAAATAERMSPYLAARAEAWRHGRTEACLNTRVRGTWDDDTLDRAVWCLDERRMELEALLAEFAQGSPAAAQNAVTAAAGLSLVEPCLDARRLARLPAPPQDREGVKGIQALLLRAGAKHAAGAYEAGIEVADEALAKAEALGWPPLVAAVRARRGALLERTAKYRDAETALADAYFQAAAVGAWEIAVSAASGLIEAVGIRQARHDEGRRWWRHAEVALAHLGDAAPRLLRAQAMNGLAGIHIATGEFEPARALFEQTRALREEVLGPDHPDVATVLNNLANVHADTGEFAQAKALYEQSRAIREQALGPAHPLVAASLTNLASLAYETGKYEEARGLYEQARGILERALGPEHPEVAVPVNSLANVELQMGRYAAARALYERALAIREKTLGPDHPQVTSSLTGLVNVDIATGVLPEAKALAERVLAIREKVLDPQHPLVAHARNNLARVHEAMGEHAAARALYEQALAIRRQALGPEHPDVATTLVGLAGVRLATGDPAQARGLGEEALAIFERAFGAESPGLAPALTLLAEVALAEGRGSDAVTLAERAVRLCEVGGTPVAERAESRFALARALSSAPAGRERALALARQALDELGAVQALPRRRAEVEAFLKAHGAG